MGQALEEKTQWENQVHRVKCYNREIDIIEAMIEKLSLLHSFRLQQNSNL